MKYIIGEADRIHVKGEYYKGEKLLRCSNCGQRGISTFDMHCSGCGFLLNRIDSIDGEIRITHTPPIIEVDELPEFTNCIEINYAEESEDKCKNCEYYRNPDYTRCHECEAESEDKK